MRERMPASYRGSAYVRPSIPTISAIIPTLHACISTPHQRREGVGEARRRWSGLTGV